MTEGKISFKGMDAASCNFEESNISDIAFEPLNPADYPAECTELISRVNKRVAVVQSNLS